MQTIKGLIALPLVALAVFAAVETYNHVAESDYVPQWKKNIVTSIGKNTRIEASSFGLIKTNKAARHKIENANL